MPTNGVGNITDDPLLASGSHLSVTSPCRGAGHAAYATGTDIDDEAWENPPSIGCDEYHAGAVIGPLSVSIATVATNLAAGYEGGFTGLIGGHASMSVWDFGDGTVVSNRPYAAHAWTALGDYAVVLRAYNESYPDGVSATVTVHVVEPQVHYVAADSANPVPPYTSWATAATNIQEAVDAAAVAGSLVLVSNGVYATGGRTVSGWDNNRVAVTKPLALHSVNGPQTTVISGGGVRCVYLGDGAGLSGFTLTNGAAHYGGGVYCESATAVVSNCVLAGNSAGGGGGAFGGTLNNCTLAGNSAEYGGGGAYGCTLKNCTLTGNSAEYAGGAFGGSLNNCTLTGNSASYSGGGAYGGTLYNCTLIGNSAILSMIPGESYGGGASDCILYNCCLASNSAVNGHGGGAAGCTLYDCTLTGNSAAGNYYGWGGDGGGAYDCTLYNCTLADNAAASSASFRGNGGGAYGCTLNNCTVIGNSARHGGGACGGTLNNCTLTGNSARYGGGGAYDVTLNNCTLTGNSAGAGGGADYCTLNNCTLTGNWADTGGGAFHSTLNNCIVCFNTAVKDANYSSSTLNYCCATPTPGNGTGNISLDPELASAWHLSVFSPCRGAGSAAYATGTDIDGESWATPPSIGCDEYHAGALTGPLSVDIAVTYTNLAVGCPVDLTALIEGRTDLSLWDFDDGSVALNQPYAMHAWNAAGDYRVVLWAFNDSYPGGVSASVPVHVVEQPVHYVAVDSANPLAPYTSWATAATNIQDAVDVASLPGALVLVSNGVYAIGSRGIGENPEYNQSRVVVTNAIRLESINGPTLTAIDGAGGIRCVYLGSGASLSGFTVTNGTAWEGGGVYCESASSVVSNCTLTGNSANRGGAAYGGTLYNCTLTGNSAEYGGGGAADCTLNNCTLAGNSAEYGGGGAYGGTLNNCTLTLNSAPGGGGADGCTLYNCIVYFNAAPRGPNHAHCTLNYCCTTPMPTNGIGNITSAPLYVKTSGWSNLRLQSNSPCINAGNNAYVSVDTDLDGSPRIVGGTVDMGAYECQSPALLDYYTWLQGYGLPTASSAAYVDSDGDLLNDWQEWRCGTNPTNALSALRLLSATSDGTDVTVTWQSVAGVSYFLEQSTNLASAFTLLAADILGQPGTTGYTDTNAASLSPRFYRVGVGP